jgi:regulator of nucleoside diphosphate kinase
MNSLVIFSDTQSGNQLEYWLVFPEDADITQKKISIFSPIGCALLGYKIGDLIEVDIPGGKKKLKVEKILHQPEAEGNYE